MNEGGLRIKIKRTVKMDRCVDCDRKVTATSQRCNRCERKRRWHAGHYDRVRAAPYRGGSERKHPPDKALHRFTALVIATIAFELVVFVALSGALRPA